MTDPRAPEPAPASAEELRALRARVLELERFTAILAHDLMAPLRGLSHYAHFLEDEAGPALSPKARRWVRDINTLASRAQAMVSELKRYSDLGRTPRVWVPVELHALATEIFAERRAALAMPEVTLRIPAPLPHLTADPRSVREIFRRQPQVLHVVDISENNMVELVRDLRSTLGYIEGDFRTFAIDAGSDIFDALCNEFSYDFVLNLSALKHVRSEKDAYTLMRMVEVNILNTLSTIAHARRMNAGKYFCVSTDKAANPVNMMGASKRIMEMFLMRESLRQPVSTARFANVAFSDGSLLHGFNQRLAKRQPISAPNDVRRYFITPQESGEPTHEGPALFWGRTCTSTIGNGGAYG